ncbi:hypothetical protein [Natronoglycomyces albus]|uniref:Uncharacterized protein n=1 Tax=Natronoglycomyces albus TaxID=2811108 RepID=A0A895XJA4_9ACTN|nr:hypothetical protein [Natronoglycomyces albus]QSB05067.1 hypothetical protein JQS30_15110 [Natronoglycomyces albus]
MANDQTTTRRVKVALRSPEPVVAAAVDPNSGSIYTLQRRRGGEQQGHLILSKWARHGTAMDFMYLYGFGTGTSLCIEPTTIGPAVWISSRSTKDSGFDRAVSRFHYRANGSLTFGDAAARVFKLSSSPATTAVSVDADADRVLLRFASNKAVDYGLFGLQDLLDGSTTPLSRFTAVDEDPKRVNRSVLLSGERVYSLAQSLLEGRMSWALDAYDLDGIPGEAKTADRSRAPRGPATEPVGLAQAAQPGLTELIGIARSGQVALTFSSV